ncbi:MAG: hypothetical protein GY737_01775 [Desulfobacteraceae bacterium]|nr:hypothetical protein [Desulfobacteraceae bacterium]
MVINKKNCQSKRKFKQTRQLVKMALNDGWTQQTIAPACRTQQSVVSAWSRGEKQGTEAQLKPLLEIYGNKLRRQSFKLYHLYDEEQNKHEYFKVEGKAIFSYTIMEKSSGYSTKNKRNKVSRVVVHDQGRGCFRLVEQVVICHPESGDEIECPDESGIWSSTVTEQMQCEEIINSIEKVAQKQSYHCPDEEYTLPFLIRKAFIQHGYSVEGIVDFPAQL